MTSISRREMLKRVGSAGAVAGLSAAGLDASTASEPTLIRIAGEPVELSITRASPLTARITLTAPAAPMVGSDGSLVERTWPVPVARIRDLPRSRTIQCGELRIRVSSPDLPAPRALHIDVADAGGRVVQRLRIDRETGAFSFLLGDRPLLGLGEGGPQFDRRGSTIGMRSGQGGYQLRTHGGRVPVPWLIGTGGWAMFVHQPYGDLRPHRADGRRQRSATGSPAVALPLDLFVVGRARAGGDHARVRAAHRASRRCRRSGRSATSNRTARWPAATRSSRRRETFREKKLPCDTLIYLGTGFCPVGLEHRQRRVHLQRRRCSPIRRR